MRKFTNYCGIDTGKDVLDYCLMSQDTHERFDVRIDNKTSVIRQTFRTKRFDHTLFIVELTGNYSAKLPDVLHHSKRPVCVVPPYQSKNFMAAMGVTNKNDKQAAYCLSLMGKQLPLTFYQPPPLEMQQRKQLQMSLGALQKQRQMLRNQLHALAQLPTVVPTAKAALEQVLDMVGRQIEQVAAELYQPAKDPKYEEKKTLAMSVKGVGEKTAESILLATNGLEGFNSAAQLAKFLGLTPTSHYSGSSVRKRGGMTGFGNASVRANLYMGTRSAIRYNHACKELYQRLRKNGKPHKVAAGAVMHKLIKQVFVCVNKKIMFDNGYELKNQKKE